MCGLAGFLSPRSPLDKETLDRLAGAMAARLTHRGPDDEGTWSDREAGVAIGFRRLSIIDLSAAGHQPMASRSGRYVIAFNGEIYNHPGLKAELEDAGAVPWRGHSDTEILAEAIDRHGFAGALPRLNGMFAIAAWDREERRLLLARDRFGEKPLYYGRQGPSVLFGSEAKALAAHPDWRGEADMTALALFLRHGYVPAPYSAWRDIRKLPPASWLAIAADGRIGEPVRYWSPAEAAADAMAAPFEGSFEDARDQLDGLIHASVRERRIADVPLGTFLSGGIDSSLITAVAQQDARTPVQSFCMGFPGAGGDEAPHARRAAEHIGTRHTELDVSAADLLAIVPGLGAMYDEPFADASQIPTALLCARAREHVTVALSGDGGDELFGGYPRYLAAANDWNRRGGPSAWRPLAQTGLNLLAARPGAPARRLRRLLRRAGAATPLDSYAGYVSWWPPGEIAPPGIADAASLFARPPEALDRVMPLETRFSVFDTMTYLPDDLEVKIDRASMAASLEVRAPLLDHRIAAFAWSLPPAWRMAGDTGKLLLRDLLYRYLPRELVDRPKQGFEPPLGQWLREDLRPWAEDLLSPAGLADSGLIAPAVVRERWHEHLSGRRNWAYPLWVVLTFQSWWQAQRAA
jgi:asparagine synthase (glutamine-hydrolysing)